MKNLFTERLRIEPLQSVHAKRVFTPLQDQRIYTYLPEDPPEMDALQRRYDFLEKGQSPDGEELWLNWVVFLRETETPVGTFQATLPRRAEGSFAYVVFPPFWRRGYAREVAKRVVGHLFETHAPPKMFAEIDTRNVASLRLVESLGLTRVATTKGADFFKGESSDEFRYSITCEEWQHFCGKN